MMVPISVGRAPGAPTMRRSASHAARAVAGEISGAEGAYRSAQPAVEWRRSGPVAELMPIVMRPTAEVGRAPPVRRPRHATSALRCWYRRLEAARRRRASRSEVGDRCTACGPAAARRQGVVRPKAEIDGRRARAPVGSWMLIAAITFVPTAGRRGRARRCACALSVAPPGGAREILERCERDGCGGGGRAVPRRKRRVRVTADLDPTVSQS